jgi:succinate dehydrogenase / fumarate reductase cytochrome b subunit
VKSNHIFLNLFLIKFPITAITSIFHRVTGIFLFLFIPFLLFFFKIALESESSFSWVLSIFNLIYVKILLFFIFSSFIYHLVMGVKHIFMDLGFFDDKISSFKCSIVSIMISFILIVLGILL